MKLPVEIKEIYLGSEEGDADQTHPRMEAVEVCQDAIVPMELGPDPKHPGGQGHSLKAQMH